MLTAHRIALGILSLPLLSSVALADRYGHPDDGAACAACGGCGALGAIAIAIPIIIFALNIALLVWVARDAKARGLDNSVVWMVLVMFTSVIGLLIYILSRPKGNLVECAVCHNRRLQASAQCPHCGNP